MVIRSNDPLRPRPTDQAVFNPERLGSWAEPTYGGVLSFMRRRYARDLAGVDVAIWGIPLDVATSNRPGARFGPQAIRRASVILDADPQYPFQADAFERLVAVDCGDASFDYGQMAEAPRQIEGQARQILDSGAFLYTLGGDHFVTLPLLRAHAAKHGPLALVQFDAHQDTWSDQEGRIDHGSFVGRAVREGLILPERSIQVGIRTHAPEDCGIEILDAEQVHDLGVSGVVRRVLERVGSQPCYLTVDIDVLDPAFAPGTGTPVSGGLSSRELLMILRRLGPLDLRGSDVVEVAPPYDHADVTAIAASTVACYVISLLAERRADQAAALTG